MDRILKEKTDRWCALQNKWTRLHDESKKKDWGEKNAIFSEMGKIESEIAMVSNSALSILASQAGWKYNPDTEMYEEGEQWEDGRKKTNSPTN